MTNIERSLVNIAQVLVRSKAVTVQHAAPIAMLWSAPQPLLKPAQVGATEIADALKIGRSSVYRVLESA